MTSSVTDFLVHLAIQLGAAFGLSRLGYRYVSDDRDLHVVSFMLGNVTFLVGYWLKSLPLSMGFALGLFAIFSIFRYRAESITLPQMALLFTAIGAAILNAAAPLPPVYLAAVELGLLGLLPLTATPWFLPRRKTTRILYDRSTLPAEAQLIPELRERTGLKVCNVHLENVDMLHDTIVLRVQYEADDS